MISRSQVHQVRRGPIDADRAGAWHARNQIGLQPCPVVDIDNGDLFPRQQVGRIHQIRIQGE